MPGVYDDNTANACEHRLTNVPILTDIVAMVESISSDYCKSVADGSRYINSPDNPYWEETEKYHQLWALTTRVKENLGFYSADNNPLAVYRAHYEAEHPLDNSRSGYLARISGLTKEESEIALEFIDYYAALADYHPELAYNFIATPTIIYNFTTTKSHHDTYVLQRNDIVYTKREAEIA